MTADGPSVSVRVPAKLNLFLAVRGRLSDGYHDLVTVMQTVSLFDELQAGVVGPPGRGHHPAGRRKMRVELRHDVVDGLPAASENLAARAAVALGRASGILEADTVASPQAVPDRGAGDHGTDGGSDGGPHEPRTVLDLRKGIPIAGGMAGGSADAAAALVALNQLWGCDFTGEELREVAAEVGSDVPFCLVGGTALATGRGTSLARVLCRGTFHWVVCQAREPLRTADVYRSWDQHCRPSESEPDAVLQALRSEDDVALGAALHNDLEPAAYALRPELVEDKAALLAAGALGAVLSGSGPTLLALGSDADAARRIAGEVASRFARVAVASSPAGGPDVSDRRAR
ncbi:MAG: 4-(cytidine 5'-diphospho)-2-C-methyl-D-erythritol kinase [Egibacteraceae bacterium]